MDKTKWILCPVCGNKTRLKIREDTELKNHLDNTEPKDLQLDLLMPIRERA